MIRRRRRGERGERLMMMMNVTAGGASGEKYQTVMARLLTK
jgi:hypothetical protein